MFVLQAVTRAIANQDMRDLFVTRRLTHVAPTRASMVELVYHWIMDTTAPAFQVFIHPILSRNSVVCMVTCVCWWSTW